jgi:hypothetical protein
VTGGEAPDPANGMPIRAAFGFLRMSAVIGGISLVLGFIAMLVLLFRTGFGAQEAFFGVINADWPLPAVLPAVGTVLSGLMIWLQTRDMRRWIREAAAALVAGYFVAVGLWLLLAALLNGNG